MIPRFGSANIVIHQAFPHPPNLAKDQALAKVTMEFKDDRDDSVTLAFVKYPRPIGRCAMPDGRLRYPLQRFRFLLDNLQLDPRSKAVERRFMADNLEALQTLLAEMTPTDALRILPNGGFKCEFQALLQFSHNAKHFLTSRTPVRSKNALNGILYSRKSSPHRREVHS